MSQRKDINAEAQSCERRREKNISGNAEAQSCGGRGEKNIKVENSISKEIVDSAIEAHRELKGPGLLESAYEEALCHELIEKGMEVKRQLTIPLKYKGRILDTTFRLDVLVENKVIVECKATTEYNKIYESQLLTYLRLLNRKLGLVINFVEKYVKDGIYRVVNNL